ncbi:hypothetical protein CR513_49722, partial [Mucuna pruriens]
MIEVIGNYGPHLKPPSYHELRVPYLKKKVIEYTKDLLKSHKVERKLLQGTRTKLFWMPCAVHYLDLMLEDIGKIAKVKKSKIVKDPKGKKETDIVLMLSFWNDVLYALKAMGSIIHVLRLVDNEKRPTMSYIYEVIDRAKVANQKAFSSNENKYKDIFAIIDRRWDCQLHPLHATSYFLNAECWKAFTNALIDLVKMMSLQTTFTMSSYIYIRELEKRSRLEQQKLEEFINEWIVGELDGDGEDVEDELNTRRHTQMQRAAAASTSRKEKGRVVEEDDEDKSSQDEGEEEYNSSSNESDEDKRMKKITNKI